MKVIVTGGAGFIGSNFIIYWLKNYPNDQVVNIDKLTYAADLRNLKGTNKNYRFVKGDISDKKFVEKNFNDADIIVNFAAESHVDNSIKKFREFCKI